MGGSSSKDATRQQPQNTKNFFNHECSRTSNPSRPGWQQSSGKANSRNPVSQILININTQTSRGIEVEVPQEVNNSVHRESFIENDISRKIRSEITTSVSEPDDVNVYKTEDEVENSTKVKKTLSLKHDLFLQKLISSFDLKRHHLTRGFYCDLCNEFEVYYRLHHEKTIHSMSEQHRLKNVSSIKLNRCKSCKAEFYGDTEFWISHMGSEYHQLLAKIKPDNCKRDISTTSTGICQRTRGRLNSWTRETRNINENYYTVNKEIPSLSVYDVLVEQRDQNTDCVESKSNNIFHSKHSDSDEEEEETVKPNRVERYSLLVKDLPHCVTRFDIFNYFKGFGYIDELMIKLNEPSTAKITFRNRFCAKNIVNNGVPISIKGTFVKLSLIANNVDF